MCLLLNYCYSLISLMSENSSICLSIVQKKDGTINPCCLPSKGNTYSLCSRHYKRRFIPGQLLCKQIHSSNFCHQIIKTGKNHGLYCSKNVFRDRICLSHLEKYLGKCYFPECQNISFYHSGLCSYHANEKKKPSCPCGKHTVHWSKKYYYCYQHQRIPCDCLHQWEKSNYYPSGVYLPPEILLLIFDFGDCYFYSTMRCLSRFYNEYQHQPNLVSKYCFTNKLLKFYHF